MAAEDHSIPDSSMILSQCVGFDQSQLDKVLDDFHDAFSDKPGSCDLIKMDINLNPGTDIINRKPYSLPQKLKHDVQHEITTLLEQKIIEPSAWSNPVVPIIKPSEEVRLCIDFQS